MKVEYGRTVGVFVLTYSMFVSACSSLFMKEPDPSSEWEQRLDTKCTSSRVWPVVDTAVGAYEVFGGLVGLAVLGPISLIDIGIGVIFLTSAGSGYSDASMCSQEKKFIKQKQMETNAVRSHEALKAEPLSTPNSDVLFQKAKKCQAKGGVWINDTCQVDVGDENTP